MSPRAPGIAARLAGIALGVTLVGAPALFELGDRGAALPQTLGPLVAAFCVIALCDVVAALRWACVPLGLALVGGALFVEGSPAGRGVLVGAGVAVAALALVPLAADGSYGGGWRAVWTTWRARP